MPCLFYFGKKEYSEFERENELVIVFNVAFQVKISGGADGAKRTKKSFGVDVLVVNVFFNG